MTTIRDMHSAGVVGADTLQRLEQIYTLRHDLLVADGGAGTIHGDPADALHSGAERDLWGDAWYLLLDGEAEFNGQAVRCGDEFGCRPFMEVLTGKLSSSSGCTLLALSKVQMRQFMSLVPQFSYLMRRYRQEAATTQVDWLRGVVEVC